MTVNASKICKCGNRLLHCPAKIFGTFMVSDMYIQQLYQSYPYNQHVFENNCPCFFSYLWVHLIRAQILLQVLNKQKELESCPKLTNLYTAATMAMWDLFVHGVFSKDWKNIKVSKYNGWCIMLGRNALECTWEQSGNCERVSWEAEGFK